MKMVMAIASFSLLRSISALSSSFRFQFGFGFWFCSAFLSQVRLEVFGLSGDNRTFIVPVSEKAEVEGKCLEGNSEVSFQGKVGVVCLARSLK